MKWTRLAQYVTDIFGLLLIVRLLSIRVRLHSVYGVFCAFLGFQLLDSLVSLLEYAFRDRQLVDYRISWMSFKVIGWILSLWIVYSLLSAILQTFPGILRISRMLLNAIFSLALVLALLTIKPEYLAAGAEKFADPIDRMLIVWYVLDRVISMTAILVLLAILVFILWFPVQMPKNLAVFSVGLVIYFGAKTALWLLRTYMSHKKVSHESVSLVTTTISFVLSACFAYWIVFITPKGQTTEVRIGHSWRTDEQDRLLGQLESMNAALLRSARR
jgi:hypothetical protein